MYETRASPLAARPKLREAPAVKHLRFLFLGGVLLAWLGFSSVSAKPGWLTDFKQAQADAKAGNKMLLVDFTGSDWCGWCMKLDREVFSKPEFKEYADKNLVLLEVDFPRRKQISAEQRAHNEKLAREHEVMGFPTILLFDSSGKKVGELGYMPGGAAAFVAELDRLRKG